MAKRRTAAHLVQSFARKIVDRTWSPLEPIPPLRSLAELYGVARATTDAAVGEAVRLGLLQTEPRQATRVAGGAEERARRLLAQASGGQKRIKVAVLTPDHLDSARSQYFQIISAKVQEKARRRGWVAEPVFWPVASRGDFPRFVIERGFAGAFCMVNGIGRLMPLHYLRQCHFPVVIYNRRFLELPLPTVLFDEYDAVRQLGKMLHDAGHRRISLLAATNDPADPFDSRQVSGWLDFCRQCSLFHHWDEPVYLVCHPDPEAALAAYLRRRPLPTALILGSGGLLDAFLRCGAGGLRVPENISVAASHCIGEFSAAAFKGEITRMELDLDRMAECSMELLARMMDGEPYPPPLRLRYRLVRGESIAPPPD